MVTKQELIDSIGMGKTFTVKRYFLDVITWVNGVCITSFDSNSNKNYPAGLATIKLDKGSKLYAEPNEVYHTEQELIDELKAKGYVPVSEFIEDRS